VVATDALREEYRYLLREHGLAYALKDQERPLPGELTPDAGRQLIRQLEAQRMYMSYDDVGTEPVANFFHRLVTVRQRGGPYLGPMATRLQGILDQLSKLLDRIVQRSGRELPGPVYVGLFPTGELNAQYHPTPEGALVLVNMGAMNLVFELLKLNVLAEHVSPSPADRALIDDHRAGWLLTEVLNAYIYGRGAFMIQPTPPLPKKRADHVEPYVTACETFILAHEYAHILAGHRESPKYALQPATPTGPQSLPVTSQAQEFEADAIAVDMLLRYTLEPDRSRHYIVEKQLFGGILFFFLIDDVVRSVAAELTGAPARLVETHPPVQERVHRIGAQLASERRHADTFLAIESFAGWFEAQLPRVRQWFADLEEVMIRPQE
jgi:hypothetical protein